MKIEPIPSAGSYRPSTVRFRSAQRLIGDPCPPVWGACGAVRVVTTRRVVTRTPLPNTSSCVVAVVAADFGPIVAVGRAAVRPRGHSRVTAAVFADRDAPLPPAAAAARRTSFIHAPRVQTVSVQFGASST